MTVLNRNLRNDSGPKTGSAPQLQLEGPAIEIILRFTEYHATMGGIYKGKD
jgi:hypothetical protein